MKKTAYLVFNELLQEISVPKRVLPKLKEIAVSGASLYPLTIHTMKITKSGCKFLILLEENLERQVVSKFMQRVTSGMASAINRVLHRDGKVYKGRFRSKTVELSKKLLKEEF